MADNSLSLQKKFTKNNKTPNANPHALIQSQKDIRIKSASDLMLAFDGFLGFSQLTWNLMFAFLVILGQVGQNVTLPIWFASIPGDSLNPYFVLTFAGLCFVIIFAIMTLIDICRNKTSIAECKLFTTKSFIIQYSSIGICNALNGIFLVFAADPSRTPPFLQAVLATLLIFWTLLFRYIILNKKPSIGQTIFALGVFYGLFLAVIPSVFGLNDSDSFKFHSKGIWKWLWPVIFGCSFIPAAIMNCVGENVLKETSQSTLLDRRKLSIHSGNNIVIANVNLWYYLCMQSLAQELTFILIFWVDALPEFGTCNNINDVFVSVKQDWRYFVGLDGASMNAFIRGIVFVICYILNYIGSSYLLRYTEGATWTALVGALVTPLGGIFWLLFELDSDTNVFKWSPNWDNSNVYVIVGLIYMTPFIYLYNMETNKMEKQAKKNELFNRLLDDDDDDEVIDIK